jgi:hypothetical protein
MLAKHKDWHVVATLESRKRLKQGKEFGNSGFSETRLNLIAFLMDFYLGRAVMSDFISQFFGE